MKNTCTQRKAVNSTSEVFLRMDSQFWSSKRGHLYSAPLSTIGRKEYSRCEDMLGHSRHSSNYMTSYPEEQASSSIRPVPPLIHVTELSASDFWHPKSEMVGKKSLDHAISELRVPAFKLDLKNDHVRYYRGDQPMRSSVCSEHDQSCTSRSSFSPPQGPSFEKELLSGKFVGPREYSASHESASFSDFADSPVDRVGCNASIRKPSPVGTFADGGGMARSSSEEAAESCGSLSSAYCAHRCNSEAPRSASPGSPFSDQVVGKEHAQLRYPTPPPISNQFTSKPRSSISVLHRTATSDYDFAPVRAGLQISEEPTKQPHSGVPASPNPLSASWTVRDRTAFGTHEPASQAESLQDAAPAKKKRRKANCAVSHPEPENPGESENVRPSVKRNFTGGKKGRKRKRGYIYNPKPMKSKTKSTFVPDDMKDVQYWENRQRNNEAANMSRQRRRAKELEMISELDKLRAENDRLAKRNKELENIISFHLQCCSFKHDYERLAPLLSSVGLLTPELEPDRDRSASPRAIDEPGSEASDIVVVD